MRGLSKIAVIVGDEEAPRSELARVLASFGIDSVLVEDASQAATCLGGAEPDLVLMTSGAERGDGILAGLPEAVSRYGKAGAAIMVCAGGSDIAVLSIAVACGADECLVAPFDADILKFKLEQTGVLAVQ